MAVQKSIVVTQYHNPKHNPEQKADQQDNPTFLYHVEKTVNTLIVTINEYLTPARVQGLIDSGINVTIQQVK